MEAIDARSQVVKLRLRGMPPEQIAQQTGLTLEEVNTFFRTFLTNNYSDLGEVELRLTQLARLESMVGMLWNTVEAGDQFTEGKQTANMIKVIEAINELMGLHRDPLKEAQVQLTKAQTELVHLVMTELRGQLLIQLMDGVRGALEAEGVGATASEIIRTLVETSYPKWYAEAYDRSIVTIKQIEEARDG